MLIYRGLGIGDFEITASAIQLGEPPGHRGAGESALLTSWLSGSSALLLRAGGQRTTCCHCLVAPMSVAACSRLQLEWPASRATGQLRSPQDFDTATSPQEAPPVGGLPYG